MALGESDQGQGATQASIPPVPMRIYDIALESLKHGQRTQDLASQAQASVTQVQRAIQHARTQSHLTAMEAILKMGCLRPRATLDSLYDLSEDIRRVGIPEGLEDALAYASNAAREAGRRADDATRASMEALEIVIRVGVQRNPHQGTVIQGEYDLLSKVFKEFKHQSPSHDTTTRTTNMRLHGISMFLATRLRNNVDLQRILGISNGSDPIHTAGEVHPALPMGLTRSEEVVRNGRKEALKYVQQAEQAAQKAKAAADEAMGLAGLPLRGHIVEEEED